jgi:hypothetical protein
MGSSLQPGPFLQGKQADVAITPGVYDFTDDALVLSGEILAFYHDWDAFMVDLPNLAAGPVDPTMGIHDAVLLPEIANETQLATLPELDTVVTEMSSAFSLLNIAIGFAPAAAWTNPSTPFVPPDPSATILVPTIPLTNFNPSITGVIGGPPGPGSATVALSNLTRVGSLSFTVGDTFLVNVKGPPNQPVAVDGILNGAPFARNTVGTTDAAGNFALSGTEGPAAVGSWIENWYVGGVLVQTFNFIVSPGS